MQTMRSAQLNPSARSCLSSAASIKHDCPVRPKYLVELQQSLEDKPESAKVKAVTEALIAAEMALFRIQFEVLDHANKQNTSSGVRIKVWSRYPINQAYVFQANEWKRILDNNGVGIMWSNEVLAASAMLKLSLPAEITIPEGEYVFLSQAIDLAIPETIFIKDDKVTQ